MTTRDEFSAVIHNLLAMQKLSKKRQKVNPKPRGVVFESSAAAAILAVLGRVRGALPEASLRLHTGMSHAAISSALLRLKKAGRISAVNDGMYRLKRQKYKLENNLKGCDENENLS